MASYTHAPKNDIFVGNIARGTTDEQLQEVFSEAGRVVNIRQVKDRETGAPKGFAFIEFEDGPSCESAIRNLNGRELNGRKLGVNYSKRSQVQADQSYVPSGGGAGPSAQPPPPQPTHQPKTIAEILDKMSLREMYEIMSNMKKFVEDEPEKARLVLMSYPNVTEALLGMQIKLGMSTQEEVDQMKLTSAPSSQYGTAPNVNQFQQQPNPGSVYSDIGFLQQQQPQQQQQMVMGSGGGYQQQPLFMPQPMGGMGFQHHAHQQDTIHQAMNISQDQIRMLPTDHQQQFLQLQGQIRASEQQNQHFGGSY